MPAQLADTEVLLEGLLLKEGSSTKTLQSRYVRLCADGTLAYWEKRPYGNEPARGEGRLLSAEEWWPTKRKAGVAKVAQNVLAIGQKVQHRKVPFSLSSKASLFDHADDSKHDGTTFSCDVLLAPSATAKSSSTSRQVTMRFAAPSTAERLKWLSALSTLLNEQDAATDASSFSPSSSSTASGDAADEAEPPAPSAAEAAVQAALDELPDIWVLWATHGEHEAASAKYAELLRKAPTCWQLLQDRGNYHMRQGELRRAEADFSAALALHAARAELYNDRAACRIEQGRHADALPDLEAALRLTPGFAKALSNLGNVQRELGELEGAKQAYNAALLLAPQDAHTWNNRGALQEQLDNLVAAELDMRRALELGGCAKAADNLARIAARLAEAELELRPLQPCWRTPPAPDQCALATYTFVDGPIGLFLVNAGDTKPSGEVEEWPAAKVGEVVIRKVYAETQAAQAGVPAGGVVIGLNGVSLGKLPHAQLSSMLQQAARPLTLRVRCPPGWCGPGAAAAGGAESAPSPDDEAAAADSTLGTAIKACGMDADACCMPLPPGGMRAPGEAK